MLGKSRDIIGGELGGTAKRNTGDLAVAGIRKAGGPIGPMVGQATLMASVCQLSSSSASSREPL